MTLIATGSEVHIAIEAQKLLAAKNISARVVSMPCCELFDQQPETYRREVLGSGLKVSIEAASTFGWERYTGPDGLNIGLHDFGASAPAPEIYRQRGIEANAIAARVMEKLKA